MTAVLPSLQSLFLEKPHPSGPVEDAIGKFITVRQISDRPIVIRDWDGLPGRVEGDHVADFDRDLASSTYYPLSFETRGLAPETSVIAFFSTLPWPDSFV
jgi:hypothetical protein